MVCSVEVVDKTNANLRRLLVIAYIQYMRSHMISTIVYARFYMAWNLNLRDP